MDLPYTALVPYTTETSKNTQDHVARRELDPKHQLLYLQPVDPGPLEKLDP